MIEEAPKNNVNTGLISLEIVARMNNVDIDMRSVVREYGITTADIEPEEIIRIAKNKGFKIKKKKLALKDIDEKYPMPAILHLKDLQQAEAYGKPQCLPQERGKQKGNCFSSKPC